MARKRRIAVAVAGRVNTTLVTHALENTPAAWDAFARAVARKKPGNYYIFEVNDRGHKLGEEIASWYVGDGFEHKEGWWVT